MERLLFVIETKEDGDTVFQLCERSTLVFKGLGKVAAEWISNQAEPKRAKLIYYKMLQRELKNGSH